MSSAQTFAQELIGYESVGAKRVPLEVDGKRQIPSNKLAIPVL